MSFSHDKKQNNKALTTFKATGSVKHWIRSEKSESIAKRLRVDSTNQFENEFK